jgi:hypothetical protein
MANVDTPFGLRPVRHISGTPYTGSANVYTTASGDGTAIYVGDPVILSGTAQTINGVTYADVDQAATGDVIVGVVVAVLPDTRDSLIYRAASTVRRLLVADDRDLLFEIQEVSGGTALTTAAIGLNANFVVGTGSTTTGQSGVELNNATEATTNTLDLQIVGLVNKEDNAAGEHAKWLVRINRHQYSNQVAGI